MCIQCVVVKNADYQCSLIKSLKPLGSGAFRKVYLDEENNLVHKLSLSASNNIQEIDAVIWWNKRQQELKDLGQWPNWLHTPTDAHPCYTCTECERGRHIVMPYVKGLTLAGIITKIHGERYAYDVDYWSTLQSKIPDLNDRYGVIYALGFADPNIGNIVVDDNTGDWTIIDLGND